MTMNSLSDYTASDKGVILYFYSNNCSVCLSLRPKIREMAESEFPALTYHEIDAETNPLITAEALVFTAPIIILFIEGKEYVRESKYLSVTLLKEKIKRYYDMAF